MPQKILKKPSEIESEGTFNDLLPLLFQDSMHIAKQLMYIWLNSTESRGFGGMPPGKILKLNPLRLNLRAFLMVYCLDYCKTAHCRIISVKLFG